MFEFFDKIVGFFDTLFSVVVNFFNSLLVFLETLFSAFYYPVALSAVVPAVIGSMVVAVVSFAVVKLILGRQ